MLLDLSKDFDVKKLERRIEVLKSRGAKIDLKEFRPVRSIEQHRYAHKVIAMFGKELGYTEEEAKYKFKMLFAQDHEYGSYEVNGDKFLKSFSMGEGTTVFTKEETTVFIQWLIDLAFEHGCYIPTPDEYIENQFEIEKQLRQ